MKWERKTIFAVSYWAFAFAAFFANYLIRNSEGYPSLLATFPWSLILLAILPLDPSPLTHFLGTDFGNFLMFPVLCGGWNALLIYASSKRSKATGEISRERKNKPAFNRTSTYATDRRSYRAGASDDG